MHKQFIYLTSPLKIVLYLILLKLGHNDHLVVGIRIILKKGLSPQGAEGRGQMVSNSAKCSNELSSETTGQV